MSWRLFAAYFTTPVYQINKDCLDWLNVIITELLSGTFEEKYNIMFLIQMQLEHCKRLIVCYLSLAGAS